MKANAFTVRELVAELKLKAQNSALGLKAYSVRYGTVRKIEHNTLHVAFDHGKVRVLPANIRKVTWVPAPDLARNAPSSPELPRVVFEHVGSGKMFSRANADTTSIAELFETIANEQRAEAEAEERRARDRRRNQEIDAERKAAARRRREAQSAPHVVNEPAPVGSARCSDCWSGGVLSKGRPDPQCKSCNGSGIGGGAANRALELLQQLAPSAKRQQLEDAAAAPEPVAPATAIAPEPALAAAEPPTEPATGAADAALGSLDAWMSLGAEMRPELAAERSRLIESIERDRARLRRVEMAIRVLDEGKSVTPKSWINEDIAAVVVASMSLFPAGVVFSTLYGAVVDREPTIGKYELGLALQWMLRRGALVQSGTRGRMLYALPPQG